MRFSDDDSPDDEEHEGENLHHEVDEPGVGAAADQPRVVRPGTEAAEAQGEVDAADHEVGEQGERQHRAEDHAVHAVQLHVGPREVRVRTRNHHLVTGTGGFILIQPIYNKSEKDMLFYCAVVSNNSSSLQNKHCH